MWSPTMPRTSKHGPSRRRGSGPRRLRRPPPSRARKRREESVRLPSRVSIGLHRARTRETILDAVQARTTRLGRDVVANDAANIEKMGSRGAEGAAPGVFGVLLRRRARKRREERAVRSAATLSERLRRDGRAGRRTVRRSVPRRRPARADAAGAARREHPTRPARRQAAGGRRRGRKRRERGSGRGVR